MSKGDRIFGIPEVIIWVHTILYHTDNRTILPRYEGSYMVHTPGWYQKQKYRQVPIPYCDKKKKRKKRWSPRWRYPNGITKKTTIPDQHQYTRMRQFSIGMIDLLHFLHPVGIQKLTYCNFGMLQIATLIAVYANWDFAMLNGIGWRWAGVIWLYSLIFYLPLDVIKFSVRYIWSGRAWDLVTEQRVRSSLQLCKSGSHN